MVGTGVVVGGGVGGGVVVGRGVVAFVLFVALPRHVVFTAVMFPTHVVVFVRLLLDVVLLVTAATAANRTMADHHQPYRFIA